MRNDGLWATAPREYGGGGLSLAHGFVIDDELNNRDLSNPPYYDPGSRYGGPVLMVWGTEEQKAEVAAGHVLRQARRVATVH